jgi:hypothetical protein
MGFARTSVLTTKALVTRTGPALLSFTLVLAACAAHDGQLDADTEDDLGLDGLDGLDGRDGRDELGESEDAAKAARGTVSQTLSWVTPAVGCKNAWERTGCMRGTYKTVQRFAKTAHGSIEVPQRLTSRDVKNFHARSDGMTYVRLTFKTGGRPAVCEYDPLRDTLRECTVDKKRVNTRKFAGVTELDLEGDNFSIRPDAPSVASKTLTANVSFDEYVSCVTSGAAIGCSAASATVTIVCDGGACSIAQATGCAVGGIVGTVVSAISCSGSLIPEGTRLSMGTPRRTCTDARFRELRAQKTQSCRQAGCTQGRSCRDLSCDEFRRRVQQSETCLRVRGQISSECYGGQPDPHDHATEEANERNRMNACRQCMVEKGCRGPR